jgi:hypothetical protein
MNKEFRIATFNEIVKMSGLLSDIVDKAISNNGAFGLDPNKKNINYVAQIPLQFGAVAEIPENPFDATGAINVMFQFRYLKSAPPGHGAGINTIVVYGDVNKNFGTADFISNSLTTILNHLKKKNPNAHLGKYGISAFSGGYYPVEMLLRERDKIKQKVGKDFNAVILGDAGHTKLNEESMAGFVNYAKEAADPTSGKTFVAVHSAIPGEDYKDGKKRKYTSTTEHSQYIADKLGLQRTNVQDDKRFSSWNLKPKSIAEHGGVAIIQADDNSNRIFNPKDPNEKETSGWVHNEIARTLPLIWNQYLKNW